MLNNRFLTVAILALAGLLLAGKTAHAQGYFYGYYYPDEHRFHTDQTEAGVYDSYGNFGKQLAPTASATQGSPASWVKDAVSKPQPSPASIKMFLPEPQAKVWFDGKLTNSTGLVRTFSTPSLEPGTAHHYVVKLAYTQDGREVTQERTIAVLAGHTAVFHFPQSAIKK